MSRFIVMLHDNRDITPRPVDFPMPLVERTEKMRPLHILKIDRNT